MIPSRIDSRDPKTLGADFNAALTAAATITSPSASQRRAAAMISTRLSAGAIGPQDALYRLGKQLGGRVLGIVTLFSMEAGTSLCAHAEVVTRSLSSIGLNTADLHWPKHVLNDYYAGAESAWSEADLRRFDRAVAAFIDAHPDASPMRK